jgi:hypothetical protein
MKFGPVAITTITQSAMKALRKALLQMLRDNDICSGDTLKLSYELKITGDVNAPYYDLLDGTKGRVDL